MVSPVFMGGDSPFHKVSEEQMIEKEECLWPNYMSLPGALTCKSLGTIRRQTQMPAVYLSR